MIERPNRSELGALLLVLAALAMCGLLYWQARGMMWGFDDSINLSGLAAVSNPSGFANFVLGGIAGPLGRPLSLLSFLANYADWPGNPWGFARLSLLLHGINALLVFLLTSRLAQRLPKRSLTSVWIAALATVLWLLMPIHTSGILLPVQRMTHLSAFFSLVTFVGFVMLRGVGVPSLPRMFGLGLWVSAGTLLAMLAKENGVTTLTLIALVEIAFFRQEWEGEGKRLWTAWVTLALVCVPAMLLWLLNANWHDFQDAFAFNRGYTLPDRLATQAVISWDYLRQTLLPRAALLGPYHDDYPIYTWASLAPWLSIAAWIGLLAAGWRMVRSVGEDARLLGRCLLLAIAWYWACHQVESTFIPLENYFEHRNYLAVLGMCLLLAVAVSVWMCRIARRGAPLAILAVFLAFQIFNLQQLTALWGRPILANELWFTHHERSVRAFQAHNADVIALGEVDRALKNVDAFVSINQNIDVAIQFFPARCKFRPRQVSEDFSVLESLVAEIRQPAGIATGLGSLGRAIREGDCHAVGLVRYRSFLTSLLANRNVNGYTRVRHHVNYEAALTAMALDDFDVYLEHAKQAFFDFPSISIGQLIAADLFRHERIDEAIEWTRVVESHAPNAVARQSWIGQMNNQRDALFQIRQMLDQDDPSE